MLAFLTAIYVFQKHPGSTGNSEKQSGKPPLPNNVLAELRKGSYYASLELVQSLCDTSYGLVDIFPVEDRKIALREVSHCIRLPVPRPRTNYWLYASSVILLFIVLQLTRATSIFFYLHSNFSSGGSFCASLLQRSIHILLPVRKMEVISLSYLRYYALYYRCFLGYLVSALTFSTSQIGASFLTRLHFNLQLEAT